MKKRYIVFLALILGIVGLIYWPPVQPPIFVPGEAVIHTGLSFFPAITNTMIATLLVDAVLLSIAFFVVARVKRTVNDVPSGAYNLFEVLIEGVYGLVEGSAGKWATRFFPWVMTIILIVLVANWMELLPGVDSIGLLEGAHEGVKGAPAVQVLGSAVCTVAKPGSPLAGGTACQPGEAAEGEQPPASGFVVVPFVRAAATDLNFTLALALIAMTMTEVYGFRAQGVRYLSKFFQFSIDKIAKSPIAAIDPVVGILELVSEISRVISFTFRLFGNIFAGQVLLFVLTSLVPVLVPLGIGLLELFVGAIQAVVFGLLTLAFMSQAVTSHHGDEHQEQDGHAAEPHASGGTRLRPADEIAS